MVDDPLMVVEARTVPPSPRKTDVTLALVHANIPTTMREDQSTKRDMRQVLPRPTRERIEKAGDMIPRARGTGGGIMMRGMRYVDGNRPTSMSAHMKTICDRYATVATGARAAARLKGCRVLSFGIAKGSGPMDWWIKYQDPNLPSAWCADTLSLRYMIKSYT